MFIERRKSPQPSVPNLFTLEEISDLLKVPFQTVRYWRNMRRFPIIKVGKRVLVDQMDLLAFLAACKQPGAWGPQANPLDDPEFGLNGEIGQNLMGGSHGQA